MNRLMRIKPSLSLLISKNHHHERVIDHNTSQSNNAHHTDQTEVIAHQPVSQHRADDTKGNGAHNDSRLNIAAKRNGQNNKDKHQCYDKSIQKSLHRFAHISLSPLEAERKPTVIFD